MSSVQNDLELYAIPGKHYVIDSIDPATGLTRICGETEAQVQERRPGAVRMTWADWTAARAAEQHTPITWEPSTRDEYHDMLNVLPPAMWVGGDFLVGEPMDHDVTTGQPRFSGYRQRGEVYTKASRPITCAELRAELAR